MAISEDASTPVIVTATSDTTGVISTASFSPPANSLVLVMCNATFDTGSTASSITVTDSVSNTYSAGPFQHVASHDANAGMWWFYYATAPGSITVTATDTSTAAAGRFLCVRVLDGASSNQTGAATGTNSGAPGTGVTTDCTVSISPTISGSVIYGIVADGTSGASTVTPDTGTTNISDANNPHNNATDKSSSAAGTSDGSGAIGWTITVTFWWAGVAMEILPGTSFSDSESSSGADGPVPGLIGVGDVPHWVG